MGFLGGLFGGGGSNWKAGGADIVNPLAGPAGGAVNQSQGTLEQQQALANALQAQGGIGNQSNVYNQLGQVASGQGPNPAQAMLAQQTGQNVAQQAALQAGQRGAGANAGLIARNAGQIGAGAQQQAVGQGATMQAQQSLNALGQQAGIAGQQVANQIGAQQNLTNANQAQAGQLIGANVAENNANVSNAAQQNAANASVQGANAQAQGNLFGNVLGGIGSAFGLGGGGNKAYGGVIEPHYASGGMIQDFGAEAPSSSFGRSQLPENSGGNSNWNNGVTGQQFGSALHSGISKLFGASSPGVTNPNVMGTTPTFSSTRADTSLPSNVHIMGGGAAPLGTEGYAHGGKVPAMVSPGEKYIPPHELNKVAQGKEAAINAGKTIQGKAKVAGDSLKNDTVPKTLEEGGIVIPRSITQGRNPGPEAQKFVEALLAKQGKKKVAA